MSGNWRLANVFLGSLKGVAVFCRAAGDSAAQPDMRAWRQFSRRAVLYLLYVGDRQAAGRWAAAWRVMRRVNAVGISSMAPACGELKEQAMAA